MSAVDADLLLDVKDLEASFLGPRGPVKAVDGVSFTVRRGETLGLVGESGSGKTVTCLSLLRLLPKASAAITGGRIVFEGADLLRKSEAEMRVVRGARISMILQDSLTSLNPAFTVGAQVAETIALHQGLTGHALRARVIDALRRVRIPDPETHYDDYPHALSGGMRQRVAGAIALACNPSLLIADEPTTALDVTVQAQYLRLLKDVQRESGMSMVFVTHDFGVVARMCDRVAVMYAGRVVETAPTREIFTHPRHPYTRALLDCLPAVDGPSRELASIEGQPPDLSRLPAGCRFAPRCPLATDACAVYPAETTLGLEHRISCWRAEDVSPRAAFASAMDRSGAIR
jgi:oligopeptide/dipeptide ABC transporter ATP-binding protein